MASPMAWERIPWLILGTSLFVQAAPVAAGDVPPAPTLQVDYRQVVEFAWGSPRPEHVILTASENHDDPPVYEGPPPAQLELPGGQYWLWSPDMAAVVHVVTAP